MVIRRLFSRSAKGLAVLVLIGATLGAGQLIPHAVRQPAQITTPQTNVRFSQLYKLHFLEAESVADVLRRSLRTFA